MKNMKFLVLAVLLFLNEKLITSNIDMATLSLEYGKVDIWLYIPKTKNIFKRLVNKQGFKVVWAENEIYTDLKLIEYSRDERFDILKLEHKGL